MTIDGTTGVISWTPGAAGDVNVTVRATDTGGLFATQSFTITVSGGTTNTAPTITSTAITTATVGVPYSYDVNASDPDAGDVLVYSLDVAPAGMTIDGSTGVISWTPGVAGDANVTVRATDTGGLFATQSFTINVQPAGTPGVLLYFSTVANTAVPGVSGTADNADVYSWDGTSFALVLDATAAGLPSAANVDAVRVVGSQIYLSFDTNTGTVVPGIGTVPDEDIVVYDSGSGSFSLFFDGSAVGLINDSEDVDAFDILGDGSVLVSTIGNVEVPGLAGTWTDEDVLRCVPTSSAPIASCTWSVYFDGSDVALNTVVSEDVDGVSAGSGKLYLSTVGAYDVAGLANATADAGGDVFSCDSPVTGEVTSCGGFSLYFRASDHGLTGNIDAVSVPVGAAPTNTAPTITSTAITTATVGVAYSYDVNASDPDVGDVLVYSLDVAPAGMTIDGTTGVISWTPGAAGDVNVTVRATDTGGLFATQSFTITVSGGTTNTAPTITSTAITTATVGVPYSYDVNASDPDAGDVLVYSLDVAPAGMTIDGSTGVISWTPGVAGDANVTVRATDTGGLFATQSFTINVQPAGTPGVLLYFSTVANTAVPGVSGTADNADVYSWDGTSFALVLDATAAGLPSAANVDAVRVVGSQIYLSFDTNTGTVVPGIGTVPDEDIVVYDSGSGSFSLFFDGSAVGLINDSEDVDAFDILGDGSVLVSTIGNVEVPGLAGTWTDEDVLRCVPTSSAPIASCTWSVYFDGSDVALNTVVSEDVDGVSAGSGKLYLSTVGAYDVAGLANATADAGGDVFSCDSPVTGEVTSCGGFSLYFRASDHGLTGNLDAISVP
jgi:hypothetical protein